MVALLRDKVVESNEGGTLMELSDGTFADLIKMIKPDMVIGLSAVGVESKVQKIAESARNFDHCAFVVGALQRATSQKMLQRG